MGLTNRAHVKLGDFFYKLDESADPYEAAYKRWSRSLFLESSAPTGGIGANLRPEQLVWNMTEFDGEGQVQVDASDPDSGRLFYRSEGLNFQIPGEARLNKSVVVQKPAHTGGGGTTTKEGNAAFSDVTGTSTTSGTDRRLSAVGDAIKSSTTTPSAGTIHTDFYLYHEDTSLTTVQGSSMDLKAGSGEVASTDFNLRSAGSVCGTVNITGLTASAQVQVNYYVYLSTAATGTKPKVRCQIVDTTAGAGEAAVVVNQGGNEITVSDTSSPSSPNATHTFTAESGKSYQFRVMLTDIPQGWTGYVTVDKVTYGYALATNNTVTISVYNETTPGTVTGTTHVVNLTNTASALVASIPWQPAGSVDYSYRVSYTSGAQRPWVDKVIENVQTAGVSKVWNIECMELGQGGYVWAAGHNASDNFTTWTDDGNGDGWTNENTPASTSNKKPIGMAHTDTYEYILAEDNIVHQMTTSATNAYIAATTATARGVAVAQDRLFVLGEDTTNGVKVYVYALDSTSLPVAISNTVSVSTAKLSPDTALRQRMCGSPTGARFFVNFGTQATRIYECDASPSTPTTRILAELPDGVKATAIAHTGGLTFVAGKYVAETGSTAQSALWVIDANGILRRVGVFREDNPNGSSVIAMQPWQRSLWMLQGPYVWRYSLATGGLFCEYELDPTTDSNARGLAVLQGHVFAAYSGGTEGIHISGTVGTYRQSSVANGSSMTSSIFDNGLPWVNKILWAIDVLTDTMATGAEVKVEYQLDQSGTWVHCGTAVAGTLSRFLISTGATSVTYRTLQIRTTLGSANGTATPVLRAVIVRSLPVETEDFFDLRLLLWDEDSTFHVGNRSARGGELAANLWGIKNAGLLTTLHDGYGDSKDGVWTSHLVKIESIEQINNAAGEGVANVRLRVVG